MNDPTHQRPLGPDSLSGLPWWLVLLALGMAGTLFYISRHASAQETTSLLLSAVPVAVRVTVVSYLLALVFGLLGGLGRTAKQRPVRELATLYVEVVRGVPLLVLVIWIGFGIVPALVEAFKQLGLVTCERTSECIPLELRGVIGLAFGYGAYIAEIVRAGIESVAGGQTEAALSLGMSRWQAMRYIILPQALRTVLPPLGNELVAMLKDTALVSVLSVPELTYNARVRQSHTFEPMEVWTLAAMVYLVMTLTLSGLVRWVEQRAAWPSGKAA